MVTEATNYMSGGVQHNLAFNYPLVLVFDKAKGAYLDDADGNCHIDLATGRRGQGRRRQT